MSDILTSRISFPTETQRTEGHLLCENEVQMVLESVTFLAGTVS
jgi:hypothetical protein